MAGRFSIDGIFKAVDRFSGPVRRMQDRMKRFTKSTDESMKKLDAQATGIIRGFGRIGVAAVAAGAAIAAIGMDVVSTGAEFERTLMSAVARFPGEIQRGTEAFEALNDAAERVGATTEFDAQQAAGALNVYAAAGFNAELAIASLAGAGDLATVSGLALDDAAKAAADSLGALGLRSENAATQAANLTRLNDVLATTTRLANTSVTEMTEAIAAGGNVAMSSGQSLETFGAAVAGMAANNIKGAEAGTAIRNTLAALQAPASTARRALQRLGVSVSDSDGNMRDMIDVVGDFERATADMGEVARNQAIAQIFGREGMAGFGALLTTGSERLREMRGELQGAQGAAAGMAATMRDTTLGDIDGFTSAIDGVKTAIFGVISGPLRGLIVQLTEWTNAQSEVITSGITEFMANFAANLETITARAEGIAFVAAGFLSIAAGIKIAAAAQMLFNAIAAANPYTLILMAIIAAIGLVIAYWPEISAFFSALGERVGEVAGAIGEWFAGAWDSIVSGVTAAFDWVSGIVMGWLDFLWGIHQTVLEIGVGLAMVLLGPLMPAFEMMGEAARVVIDFIAGYFAFLWDGIKAGASIVGGWLSAVWQRVSAAAAVVAQFVGGYFSFMWDGIVAGATFAYDTFLSIWSGITGFFAGLWEGVVSMFNEYIMPMIDALSGFVSALQGLGATTLGTDGGDGASPGTTATPQVAAPAERAASSSSSTSTTTTSTATVNIRDTTGRARMTGGGPGITFQRSGAPG